MSDLPTHNPMTGFFDLKPIILGPQHAFLSAQNWEKLALWGLLGIVIAVAIIIIIKKTLSKRAKLNALQLNTLSPLDQFFVALDKIKTEFLSEQNNQNKASPSSLLVDKQIFSALSNTFRNYLEAQTKFPATKKTASEIKAELSQYLKQELCFDITELISKLEKFAFEPQKKLNIAESVGTQKSQQLSQVTELLQQMQIIAQQIENSFKQAGE